MTEENGKKVGRPQKYVFWSDWDAWLIKEWYPFKTNDLPHLKNDIAWLKKITIGILFSIFAGAIAIICTG